MSARRGWPILARVWLVTLAGAGFTLSVSAPAFTQPIFTTAPPSLQRVAPDSPVVKLEDEKPAVQSAEAIPEPSPAPQLPSAAPPEQAVVPSAPAAPVDAIARKAPEAPTPAPLSTGDIATTHSSPIGALANANASVVLRHLVNNIQGFRLVGEIGSSEWPFFVTDAQARGRLRFQVGYLAAVSIMPEASYLTLVINDTPVGRTNIVGTRGVRTAMFDIPEGLVKPGFNSVRLKAEQRHRVDCSLEATYELWTQIDPTLTGLVLPDRDAGVSNLGELAALPPDEEGALPIRAVMPGRGSLASVERVVRAVQAITLAGRFAQPIVDVGPLADGEYGINLAIGTAADLKNALGDIALGPVSGPRVAIYPASAQRRATIVATGATEEDVNAALTQFLTADDMRGSREGLRAAAAFPGFHIFGGQRVKLRDIGLFSQEFSGRLYRAAFNIFMPPDFYSADYGKAVLHMAGGYASGLSRNAQIVVTVNGHDAASLKLLKSAGDVFKENPIPLPLGHLRPGLNRIEIEAQLPAPGDAACDPIGAISGRKRFLFLDSTEIEIPRLARIARMPDLAVTATGGYPYINGAKRPILYLPAPSREAVGAAATIAAHLAIAAGKTIDFRLTLTDPGTDAGATLVVAPASALDEDFLNGVGLDAPTLTRIWAGRLNETVSNGEEKLTKYEAMARHRLVLQRNFPAACHMPIPAGGFRGAEKSAARALDMNPVATIADEAGRRDLYGEWDTDLRADAGIGDWAKAKAGQVSGFIVRRLSGARDWIDRRLEGAYRKPAYTKQASLIVAQSLLGSTGDDVRTLVVAPNAALLSQAVDCLVDPRVWQQVGGRIAVLNPSEAEIVEVPVDYSRLIPTQPLSIENLRLIAAGWLSLNTAVYVEMALVMALLLAITTHRFLKSVGRQS